VLRPLQVNCLAYGNKIFVMYLSFKVCCMPDFGYFKVRCIGKLAYFIVKTGSNWLCFGGFFDHEHKYILVALVVCVVSVPFGFC